MDHSYSLSRKKFANYSQGQDNIITYYNKITKLWCEYDACRKNTARAYWCTNEDEGLLELLMGLNNNFINIKC